VPNPKSNPNPKEKVKAYNTSTASQVTYNATAEALFMSCRSWFRDIGSARTAVGIRCRSAR